MIGTSGTARAPEDSVGSGGVPLGLAIINHRFETFTPARSGAICTIVHEVCMRAQADGTGVVVLSRSAELEQYRDTPVVSVPAPCIPKDIVSMLALRAQRKLTGYRDLRHAEYIRRVTFALRYNRLADSAKIVFNDPELAVGLAQTFRRAPVVLWFQNQLECKDRFRRQLAGSGVRCIAVSNFTARWVENYYGLKSGSVPTVYNAVDAKHFSPAPQPPPGLPVINFLGRTGIEKGPDILLEAAILLSQKGLKFKLQLIGSNHWDHFELDDYQRKLAALVEKLERMGIPVRRPGHIGRAALPDELRQAHIHVFTSRWDEPFGMATLEGMACGLATIASNTGGTPEVIGDAGLLFERENVAQLAKQLERLAIDESLRRDFGSRAHARAANFTWEKTWLSLWNIINQSSIPSVFGA